MLRRAACALALACACGFGTNATDTDQGTGGETTPTGTSGTTGPIVYGACAMTPDEEALLHSYLGDDGQCYCEDGFTWTDRYNPNDFGCTEVLPRVAKSGACDASAIFLGCGQAEGASCDCEIGDAWCPNDLDDSLRCCHDSAQQTPAEKDDDGSTSTTGTSSGDSGADTSSTGTTAPTCMPIPTDTGGTTAAE